MTDAVRHSLHSQLRRPVMIMAGGTGGHIFPGLAVAGELRQRNVDVLWLGSSHGMENTLVPQHGYAIENITIAGLRGRGLKTLLAAPFVLFRAVHQAQKLLRRYQPRCVLSMGGFAAGPGGIAAWLLRRPVVVHEQNSVPGFTNRVLAKLARRVLTGFPDAFEGACIDAGNPVRREIAELPEPAERWAQRVGALRLLVLGGSQGAASLNKTLPQALSLLPAELPIKIVHQCGKNNEQQTRSAYANVGVDAQVDPFLTDMAGAYGWADLIVCRSGALTVAELAAAGVGAVLVPFPFAVDDHQTSNAQFLVELGAARVCQEAQLTPEALAAELTTLLSDRQELKDMAIRARSAARPHAAATVAAACLEVAQ
ncbi:MAG: undecaprenyldiphospho-muramoylpentapeptide beta-N-acetylglucosaminyltransferase [Lysobacterales bacterium]